jgi:hypothetical protein
VGMSFTPAPMFGLSPGLANEDEYALGMRNLVGTLQKVPGRVSEKGVIRLANQNKFEIFQDTTSAGRRISLGGAIVLVDIDFVSSGKVSNVSVSLASSLKPSDESRSFISLTVSPSPEMVILEALKQPRLDVMAEILSFLARLDKLSSPSVDCFRALDEISNALFEVYESCPDCPFGILCLNPCGKLGVGLEYHSDDRLVPIRKPRKWLAVCDVRELEPGFTATPLIYSKQWLANASQNKWNDPLPSPDAKARLVLRLDPPVVVSQPFAESVSAVFQSANNMNQLVSRTSRYVYHPDESSDLLQVCYANLLPYLLVEISEIPINHPREIPGLINSLKQFIVLLAIWNSMEGQHEVEQNEQQKEDEMSFADAIVESDMVEKPDRGISSIINICDNGNLCLEMQSSDFKSTSFVVSAQRGHVRLEAKSEEGMPNLPKLEKALQVTQDLGIFFSMLHRNRK